AATRSESAGARASASGWCRRFTNGHLCNGRDSNNAPTPGSALTPSCPLSSVRRRGDKDPGSRKVPIMNKVLKRLIKGGLRKLGNSTVDYDRIVREVKASLAADYQRVSQSLDHHYERVSNHLRVLEAGRVDQGVQNLLALRYRDLLHHQLPL